MHVPSLIPNLFKIAHRLSYCFFSRLKSSNFNSLAFLSSPFNARSASVKARTLSPSKTSPIRIGFPHFQGIQGYTSIYYPEWIDSRRSRGFVMNVTHTRDLMFPSTTYATDSGRGCRYADLEY